MGVASAQVNPAATCGSCTSKANPSRSSVSLPASDPLSLASPMERSRLPLPSLLCLFGVLLMHSPELPMGIARNLSDVPATAPGVREALAFTMQEYNKRRRETGHLFKVLTILRVQTQLETRDEYDFRVEVVETECVKWNAWYADFERLQTCPLLPGSQKRTCYFKVILRSPANLAVTACS